MRTITILFLILVSCTAQEYELKVNTLDPQAKCLDGSSPALLVHQGTTPKNILIFAIGNTSCAGFGVPLNRSLDDCLRRTQTWEGSSKFPFPFDFFEGLGFLETDQTLNKFASWTKIIISNCDGTAFQGYNNNPVEHKGTKMYFRGSAIMRAHFNWINNNYGLEEADKIVFAGSSIGGSAVSLWIDHLKGLVTKPEKIYGIIDSGLFTDPYALEYFFLVNQQSASFTGLPSASNLPFEVKPPQEGPVSGIFAKRNPEQNSTKPQVELMLVKNFQQFMKISNKDERPPHKKCIQAVKDPLNDWKCIIAFHSMNYHDEPIFWIQPQYDRIVLRQMLRINCISEGTVMFTLEECLPNQKVAIDKTRSFLVQKALYPLAEKGHSVWSNACVWHTSLIRSDMYYSDMQRAAVGGQQLTIQEAVEKFVFNDEVVQQIDAYSWPYNSECAF